MKIALAQINPIVGDIEGNYQKIVAYIRKARDKKSDIVVFPELALCGYPPEDLLFKKAFLDRTKQFLVKLKRESSGITVIAGYAEDCDGVTYNSAAVLADCKKVAVYRKRMLPNYSVFDEKRYFHSGDEALIIDQGGCKICLSICEDIWQDDGYFRAVAAVEPFSILINLSASPYNHGKLKQREKTIADHARRLGVSLVYCNIVGGQDELVFDGGSLVADSKGRIPLHASRFEEDLLIYDTGKKYVSLKIKEDRLVDSYNALCMGIRDYMHKNGFAKVIIGLSGGIDSALVATLAVKALGRKNVLGVTMPSVYTSSETFDDALKLAENLGIKCFVIPIKDMIDNFSQKMDKYIRGGDRWSQLAYQNMQARMRGNILMTLSNKYGYLVLNTGNKSEVSVGYCTLYGDMVGGFSVLKDVYKTKVFKLSKYINKRAGYPLIPYSIISRPPSAELKDDQKDEDELLPYNTLDKILKLYIEKDYSLAQIVEEGFCKDEVKFVIRKVDVNEYKRRQAPPGIRITQKAFGKDRRVPITNRFKY